MKMKRQYEGDEIPEQFEEQSITLEADLNNWAVSNNITHRAVNELLQILSTHVPASMSLKDDARTPTKTTEAAASSSMVPTHIDEISEMRAVNIEKAVMILSDQLSGVLKMLSKLDTKLDSLNGPKTIALREPSSSSIENIKKIFPLQDIEDVNKFEIQLENFTVLNEYLLFLDRIGGSCPKDKIRKIFGKVFSNDFAAAYTYRGRKNKINLSESKMMHIIKDKVIDDHDGFTEASFHKEAMEWFRLGQQRKSRIEKRTSYTC